MIDYSEAEQYLMQQDPVLAALIAAYRPIPKTEPGDYFAALCRAIIGQQLSVKAATTIHSRFTAAMPATVPQYVRSLSLDQARQLGLSRQKYAYLQDLAHHTDLGILDNLDADDDSLVVEKLTAIKGIGVWTAEMFLMFTLQRPDVFSHDDLGLRRAIEKHYGTTRDSPRNEYSSLASRWSPYRTVASQYLWRSLDNEPK